MSARLLILIALYNNPLTLEELRELLEAELKHASPTMDSNGFEAEISVLLKHLVIEQVDNDRLSLTEEGSRLVKTSLPLAFVLKRMTA